MKKRKTSKTKKLEKKSFSIMKGIVIFAFVSFFSWLFLEGVTGLFKLDLGPWSKVVIGSIGLIIASWVGWSKFK